MTAAVVMPLTASAGASPVLLMLPILFFAFYLERRPTQRQVLAVVALVLAMSFGLYADDDDDIVIQHPCMQICPTIDTSTYYGQFLWWVNDCDRCMGR